MSKKRILSIVSVVVISGLLVYGIILYNNIFSKNTKFNESELYVHIPTDATYEEVKTILTPYVQDMDKFETVAKKRSYTSNVKSGRFLFKKGMTSFELVTALRQNVPVKLAFNNQERLENFAGRIGSQIEADSTSLMKAFYEPEFLKENGFTENDVISIFVPNTYEFYWNTTAAKFRDKMVKEYRKFWTEERIAKAKAQGLTPVQATTLASIVHKETVKKDERPRVAGVYLNRLKTGMMLQADPTVIYAKKKQLNDFDMVIKRVFSNDLKIDSPYNTYFYTGLPPGPIAMPDISAIDAVLNPEKHNYIYFCASVTRLGYHDFAVTQAQHEVNARNYVAWLREQIRLGKEAKNN
ncbi:MAG: endolytic transglycosylase MltG [Bacteroidota bacterium]